MASQKPPVERMALAVTRSVGSPASIVVHTLLFAASFLAVFFGWIAFDLMLLVLTTIVSLEAIYLAIFIQMTINFQAEDIAEVQENVEEIQEDVEGISEDVDEIQKDVDELQEDVEGIGEDVEEIAEEEETEEAAEERRKKEQKDTLETIQSDLRKLLEDVERLKKN